MVGNNVIYKWYNTRTTLQHKACLHKNKFPKEWQGWMCLSLWLPAAGSDELLVLQYAVENASFGEKCSCENSLENDWMCPGDNLL